MLLCSSGDKEHIIYLCNYPMQHQKYVSDVTQTMQAYAVFSFSNMRTESWVFQWRLFIKCLKCFDIALWPICKGYEYNQVWWSENCSHKTLHIAAMAQSKERYHELIQQISIYRYTILQPTWKIRSHADIRAEINEST